MTQLSSEYAQALFELAMETDRCDETEKALTDVRDELMSQKDYAAMLRCPAIPRAERLKSIDAVFGGLGSDIVLAVLKMMCSKGHLNMLEGLVKEYKLLNREHKGILLANVSSAVALSEEEKERLRQGLKQRFGKNVELNCTVDPALIGGIRVEADGKVIDGSIRYKLQQIKEVMDA